MAHSKQALKRARQSERKRLANKTRMTRVKSSVKKLQAAIAAGDKGKAAAALQTALQDIDKAAKKDVIHANNAARRKSQAVRAFKSMT
jgi:small subunit ribosomal protein S20